MLEYEIRLSKYDHNSFKWKKRSRTHEEGCCAFFNHMEIHASIPENRVLQLARRQKNGFRKHVSLFLYNVFRHLELQQQTFLSF